jgi:hypothetical protein
LNTFSFYNFLLKGSTKRIKCTYFADKLILNCTGYINVLISIIFEKINFKIYLSPSGRVECEAADLFPIRVRIVGISFPKDTTSSLAKFDLHPLRQDNSAWLNNRVMLNGSMTTFSIYQSNLIRDSGFRLRDAQCFERLASLFRSSTTNISVPVTDEVKNVAKVEKSKNRIDLLGEIFWFERSLANPQRGTVSRISQKPIM